MGGPKHEGMPGETGHAGLGGRIGRGPARRRGLCRRRRFRRRPRSPHARPARRRSDADGVRHPRACRAARARRERRPDALRHRRGRTRADQHRPAARADDGIRRPRPEGRNGHQRARRHHRRGAVGPGCGRPPRARLHPEAAGRARHRRRPRPRRPDDDLGGRAPRFRRRRARRARGQPPRPRCRGHRRGRRPGGARRPRSPGRGLARTVGGYPRAAASGPDLCPRAAVPLDVEPARRARRLHPGGRHDRPGHPAAAGAAPLAAQPRARGRHGAREAAEGPGGDRDPAPRAHLVDGRTDRRAGARQHRVGDLRRGARLRDRPQRERPHREPHPAGGLHGRALDDPAGRQRPVHPGAADRRRGADRGAGHHRRVRAQPRAAGQRRHPVGGAAPGRHRCGRRAAWRRRPHRWRGCPAP